ncbi:cupin domain-containing protein [Francisella frigiditurris]|uniref:Cupin domain protein n=1 Tax=Francisella frigiditurris TaxID=1542390 RepID=A0A1J0KUY5_9GAMM|nr:cupin domain-containing protein [Francisella frigiditurris]APC97490.1 cupin domain protein [Francisella frigiditurris]
MSKNIFEIGCGNSDEEIFIDLFKKEGVHIEKIISYGQVTPKDNPYIQDHDEWVLVLSGRAELILESKEYTLDTGEYLFIPKGVKHWVTYTECPTVWLAVHLLK